MASKAIKLKGKNDTFYPCPYWPIGSIYISVINENPAKWFGGNWQSFGAGRVLVGVDTSQSEFNSVLKTGGDKSTESHYHDFNCPVAKHEYVDKAGYYTNDNQRFLVVGNNLANLNSGINNGQARMWSTQIEDQANVRTALYGIGTSGNLQPFITVYMWRRTA